MKSWMTPGVALFACAALSARATAQFDPNFQDQIVEIQTQLDKEAPEIHQDPARVLLDQARLARKTRQMEKAAFLGVITVPVAPAMREQLKLPRGIGLTVEGVEHESPAEAAGIKQYDVIQKVNDQWLINAHQLAVLVRMHKPGEEVTLGIVRQGQPMNVTAKLIEKEMAVLDGTNLLGMPGVNVFGPEQFVAPDGGIILKGPMPHDFDKVIKLGKSQSMTMSMSDDEHTLTMSVREGRKHFTALDRDGNVVFNGPIDTEEQRAALPQALKGKLEKLESKPGMIRVKVGSKTAPMLKANERKTENNEARP
jgi:hypothetical protein